MSITDDFQSDFDNVFFADFKHYALVDGVEDVGYLDVNSHQFLELDTDQRVFSVPTINAPSLKRNDVLIIQGQNYHYVTTRTVGDIKHFIIQAV